MSEYTLTKHKGKYALTFNDGQRRRRSTTGTDRRGEAESIARGIWQRLNAARGERLEDLWPAYVQDRVKDGVLEPRFHVAWKAMKPHFGKIIGSRVSRDDCRAYHAHRQEQGKSDSTVATELSLLRACLRWKYKDNAPSVWVPPASPPRDHWLTKDQVNELIEAASAPHIKLFLILAATTGARASAILDLTWDRVDLEAGLINYKPAGRATTNKRRVEVPMNPRARTALTEAHQARLSDYVIEYGGQPIGTVKKALQRLSAKTGIKVSPHVLRHSCAVWMAQADVPMSKIAQFLGHTKTAVTEKYYARYSPSFMADASAATNF